MKGFEVHEPTTLDEAIELLDKYGEDAKPLAGGTDVMVDYLQGEPVPENLISITAIRELKKLEMNGGLHVGTVTTFHQIDRSAFVRGQCEMLAEAASLVGARQTRNLATIGGNICNAAPSADSAPPLLAANAAIEIAGPQGRRCIPIASFFRGPRKTALDRGELVLEIMVPEKKPFTGTVYRRHTPRRALDLAMVGVAVSITLEPATRVIQGVGIALGAVAPVPLRVAEAENLLIGNVLSEELLDQAAECAVRISQPRTSVRGSADYKRDMIRVLTRRCIVEAVRRAQRPEGLGGTSHTPSGSFNSYGR